jgi:hypothetical protein
MPSRYVSLVVFAVFACGQCGCTVVGQYQDLQTTNQRIASKETELDQEEMLQAQLQDQMKQLSAELSNKKLTSDQLDAHLAALQRKNQGMKTDNARRQAKQHAIAAELSEDRARLAALKQTNAQTDEQLKQQHAQYEQLQKDISIRLAILAQAG